MCMVADSKLVCLDEKSLTICALWLFFLSSYSADVVISEDDGNAQEGRTGVGCVF